MSEEIEFLNEQDIRDTQKEVGESFKEELLQMEQLIHSELFQIYNELQSCATNIQNAIINSSGSLDNIVKKDIQMAVEDNVGIKADFVRATQVLYKLRTFLTGQEISFLENFDGIQQVINQNNWLENISANSSHIVLLDSVLKDTQKMQGVDLSKSSIFSQYTRQNATLIEQLVQKGRYDWREEGQIEVTPIRHKTYQKKNSDKNVQASYTSSRQRNNIILLYYHGIYYNLGTLYEAIISKFEEVASYGRNSSVMAAFQSQIHSSDYPLEPFFSNWDIKDRNVPGLTEGDVYTTKKQWVQIKRNNNNIISLHQVYTKMLQVLNILKLMINELLKGNLSQKTKNKIVKEFTDLYTSEKSKLNNNIKRKISKQLTLLGEPLLS